MSDVHGEDKAESTAWQELLLLPFPRPTLQKTPAMWDKVVYFNGTVGCLGRTGRRDL